MSNQETIDEEITAFRDDMPKELVEMIAEIKGELEPARQSAEVTDGEGESARIIHYSSTDDIFEAIRKAMARKKLICWLEDDGFQVSELEASGEILIQARFIPILQTPDLVYSSPRQRFHMVTKLESMNTSAGIRTLAEKTFLRNLFKLPSTKEAPERANSAPFPRPESVESDSADSSDGAGLAKPRKFKNPLIFPQAESEEIRNKHLEGLKEKIGEARQSEKPIAVIEDYFKAISPEWAKLKPHDKQLVKVAVTKAKSDVMGGKGKDDGEQ